MKNHISFCVNNNKRLTFCFVNELQDVLRFLPDEESVVEPYVHIHTFYSYPYRYEFIQNRSDTN